MGRVNRLACLLPDPSSVRLESWSLEPASPSITLTLKSRHGAARCPLCGGWARRVHSRYERTLTDLPWGEHAVAVRLRVRRMFCDNARCERRIFTERLPGVAAPWARKTARLAGRLTAVGAALGAAAGARLGRKVGLMASRNTLLRLVRRAPLPPVETPAALGVDDWAMRKRFTCGTVLVDLERRRPVALLPDREADTLAAWLRGHPGVAVIARDRSGASAEGAGRGAPGAVQVADRFHLLQNLAEALELAFTAHARELREAEQARRQAAIAEGAPVRPDPPPPPKRPRVMAAARRERRMAAHRRVWELWREGWPGEAIARHLGIGRTTVYRHLKSQAFPERKGRSDAGRSSVEPWGEWVIGRWNAGQRNGRRMLRELRERGFAGNYATVLRYLNRLRGAGRRGAAPPRACQAGAAAGGGAEAGADAAHGGVGRAPPAGAAGRRGQGLAGRTAQAIARAGRGRRARGGVRRSRPWAAAGAPRPMAQRGAGRPGRGAAPGRQAAAGRRRRGARGGDPGLEQRSDRGSDQPAQDPEAPDVWPRWPRPAGAQTPADRVIPKSRQDPKYSSDFRVMRNSAPR